MIKAILLDFGGVVFRNKEEYEGPKGYLKVDPDLWDRAMIGLVDDEAVFQSIAKNYDVDSETVKRWLYSKREPNDQLLSLIRQLKPEIKVAVISNGLKTLVNGFIGKFNLVDKFDTLLSSADVGAKKPDPKIYLSACEKLGVKPAECLLVDNDPVNIQGAENIGMQVLLFEDVEQLETDLKNRSLLLL